MGVLQQFVLPVNTTFYILMYDLYNIVTAPTATTNNAKNESFVEQ